MTSTSLRHLATTGRPGRQPPRPSAVPEQRAEVSFASVDGRCAGWLYRPASDPPAP
jgi:hypothetical protein